jgi:polyferredoxin
MKRQHRISRPRLAFQVAALVLFNCMAFGVASFGETPYLRDIYWPNATTKFFADAPTYSLVYKLQDTAVAEFKTLYTDIVLPIFLFIILVLILGRVWCAWLCPLGLPQDMLSGLRKRLGIPYYRMSKMVSDALHATKYLALFLILSYTVALGMPGTGMSQLRTSLPIPYEWVDPNRALYVYPQIWLGMLPPTTIVPIVSTGTAIFFTIMCFVIRRFWCHICPAGALMGLVHRKSLMQLTKDATKCTSCRICARVCPMGIEGMYKEKTSRNVTARNCTHCYSCLEACPEDGALSATFMGKKILTSKSMVDYPV